MVDQSAEKQADGAADEKPDGGTGAVDDAQEEAAAAQRGRLEALEAEPSAAPSTVASDLAPASAPSHAAVTPVAPRNPAVSAFARPTSRFSVTVLEGHADGITGVALLGERGSTVATASFDCTVKWWDSRTGTELKSLVSNFAVVPSSDH